MTAPLSSTGPAPVSPGWRAVAWVLATVCWALVVGAVVLSAAAGEVPDALADWVMDLVVAAVYPVTTILLLPRVRNTAVWILAVLALGCALAGFAEQYDALGGRPPSLPLQELAAYAPIWVWMPGTYASIAILPWILTTAPRPRRERAVVVGAVTVSVAATLLACVRNATIVLDGSPHNPLGVPGWQGFTRALGDWPERTLLAVGVLALVDLLLRWRREGRAGEVRAATVSTAPRRGEAAPAGSSPDDGRDRERRTGGLGWLVVAQAVLVVAFVVFLWPVSAEHYALAAEVSGVALIVAQAFLPGAVLVLVLGRRLWRVDAAVSRVLTWTTLTVSVVVMYLGALSLLGALVPGSSKVAVAVVVALVTMAVAPVRRGVQRRVDRLVYGSLSSPGEVTRSARLWSQLDGVGEGGTGGDLDGVARALREGLRLGDVEIVSWPPSTTPAGSGGTVTPVPAPDDALVVPLVSRRRPVGSLVVRPRAGERLDARTRAVVEQVAGLLGLTLDLAQSNAALEVARARLVEIRHDERRVLRRDLHDGLGPAIAGLRLGVGAALNLLDRDAAAAATMLEEVQLELSRRGEDIRLLSRALLPPALDDGNLDQALTGLADRFSGPSLLVTAHVDPQVLLAGTHQVAIYHIAAEALMNVHRHARASRCELRVSRDVSGAVQLLVLDDGVGIAPAVEGTGIGLSSMRERVDELGGTLEIGPRGVSDGDGGGGTRVCVRLPARQAQPAT